MKELKFQSEINSWFSDIRKRHPLAKMGKEDVLQVLRQVREDVWKQRHSDKIVAPSRGELQG